MLSQKPIEKFILGPVAIVILLSIKMKTGNKQIDTHKNDETWSKSGIDTAGFWSR
jgi:hypothetical protein